jgi:hypothetical protein
MDTGFSGCRNLVVVAGHAPFKESVTTIPAHPEQDDCWVLQPFQRGEPPLYIDHIRRGVDLLRDDPHALLICSGGYTRREAGLRWSEAATYAALAAHFRWWMGEGNTSSQPELASRIATEDFSRDSFENLLFSLCRFQQLTGDYPRRVTLVSWEFKAARFDWHRAAVRFPADRFRYEGCHQPLILDEGLKGEAVTLREFMENRYGGSRAMVATRAGRNPFNRRHDFERCPGMEKFFEVINDPENGGTNFPERLPWER